MHIFLYIKKKGWSKHQDHAQYLNMSMAISHTHDNVPCTVLSIDVNFIHFIGRFPHSVHADEAEAMGVTKSQTLLVKSLVKCFFL